MPPSGSGLIVYFDEDQRRELIIADIDGHYETFSEALSVPDWEIGQLSVALLAFSESTIDYIALAKKGRTVVSHKCKVEFSNIVDIQSISLALLESKLNQRIRPHFIRASRGIGGRIPEKTWSALVHAIKEERPNQSSEIERLISLARYSGFLLTGEIAEALLLEREALGAALDVFGGNNKLRDRVLGSWAPRQESLSDLDGNQFTARLTEPNARRASFLEGIPRRFLQEESALQHDLFNWGGAPPDHEAGISVFELGGRRLEIIYANKNDLEHLLGVDLIYYNRSYDSFVLVQYKLMRREGSRDTYRPDSQLSEELSRMDTFLKANRRTTPIESHREFRLNDDGFMIKLVPNHGLRPASGELIKGMYLPREYMHFLIGPKGPKGDRGGPCITFDGAPRYLTNSQFAEGVHSGWIGTSGHQSKALLQVIRRYQETGRAILVAYESSQDDLNK